MGTDPGGEVLRETGFSDRIMAGTEGGDKEMNLSDLPGERILDRESLTGIIDNRLKNY